MTNTKSFPKRNFLIKKQKIQLPDKEIIEHPQRVINFKKRQANNTRNFLFRKPEIKKMRPKRSHFILYIKILCSFLEQCFNLTQLAAELFVGLKQIVHCLAGMQHCRVVTVTDTETDFGS
jgi:hypothetical protein